MGIFKIIFFLCAVFAGISIASAQVTDGGCTDVIIPGGNTCTATGFRTVGLGSSNVIFHPTCIEGCSDEMHDIIVQIHAFWDAPGVYSIEEVYNSTMVHTYYNPDDPLDFIEIDVQVYISGGLGYLVINHANYQQTSYVTENGLDYLNDGGEENDAWGGIQYAINTVSDGEDVKVLKSSVPYSGFRVLSSGLPNSEIILYSTDFAEILSDYLCYGPASCSMVLIASADYHEYSGFVLTGDDNGVLINSQVLGLDFHDNIINVRDYGIRIYASLTGVQIYNNTFNSVSFDVYHNVPSCTVNTVNFYNNTHNRSTHQYYIVGAEGNCLKYKDGVGNYYYNYTGIDNNSINGIGDTAQATDLYPLMDRNYGRITNVSGTGIANATVYQVGASYRNTTTNATGYFNLSTIGRPSITLNVSKDGISNQSTFAYGTSSANMMLAINGSEQITCGYLEFCQLLADTYSVSNTSTTNGMIINLSSVHPGKQITGIDYIKLPISMSSNYAGDNFFSMFINGTGYDWNRVMMSDVYLPEFTICNGCTDIPNTFYTVFSINTSIRENMNYTYYAYYNKTYLAVSGGNPSSITKFSSFNFNGGTETISNTQDLAYIIGYIESDYEHGTGNITFNQSTYNYSQLGKLSMNITSPDFVHYHYNYKLFDPEGSLRDMLEIDSSATYPHVENPTVEFNIYGNWTAQLVACYYESCLPGEFTHILGNATVNVVASSEIVELVDVGWSSDTAGNTPITSTYPNVTRYLQIVHFNGNYSNYSYNISFRYPNNTVAFNVSYNLSGTDYAYIPYSFSSSNLGTWSFLATKRNTSLGYFAVMDSTNLTIAAQPVTNLSIMSGIVRDSYNDPVYDARVRLVKGYTLEDYTNSLGYYQIPDILDGLYNITVSKTGYNTTNSSFNFTGSSMVSMDFILYCQGACDNSTPTPEPTVTETPVGPTPTAPIPPTDTQMQYDFWSYLWMFVFFLGIMFIASFGDKI